MNEKSKLKKDLEKMQYYDGHTPANHRIDDLSYIVSDLINIVEFQERVFNKEQVSLKAAPFQPECKCTVVRDEDGSLTIYHCQYHRSIKYIHGKLDDMLEDQQLQTLNLMNMIYEDRAFLDECKKNSLTGEIGKPRDENVGR